MFLDVYHIINYFQEVLLKTIFSLNPAKLHQQHRTFVMSYALSYAYVHRYVSILCSYTDLVFFNVFYYMELAFFYRYGSAPQSITSKETFSSENSKPRTGQL